jgi:hypothetical protein
MTDRWTELLTCSYCRAKGLAHFSQPPNRTFETRVDATPEGFKLVRVQFGKTFYCQACDREAQMS